MDDFHLGFLFLVCTIVLNIGIIFLSLYKEIVIPFSLLAIFLILPLFIFEYILNYFDHRTEFLPDYGDFTLDLKEITKNPGGILKPDVNTRGRSSSRWRSIHWQTDSNGFRNSNPVSMGKSDNVFRILVLGDSFSAGYRLSQEETFPRQIEKKLGSNVEVLNAETEDTTYSTWYLEHYGFKFQPDLVILAFCLANDFTENHYRMSFSKSFEIDESDQDNPELIFHLDKAIEHYSPEYPKLKFPAEYTTGKEVTFMKPDYNNLLGQFSLGRIWISIRTMSHAGAGWSDGALFPSDLGPEAKGRPHPMDMVTGFGFYSGGPIPEVEKAYNNSFNILRYLKLVCNKENTPLIIVIIPQSFQVYPDDWKANCLAYSLRSELFDLDKPNKWFGEIHRDLGTDILDPLESMRSYARSNEARLYLKGGDQHWNAKGAEFTADYVVKNLPFRIR